jgi:DNA polymerase III subunit alpha
MLLPRSYSHHSLLSAIPQVPALVKDAKAKGYTFIALTDEDTGSGMIDLYDACKKEEMGYCPASVLRIPNVFATTDSSTVGSSRNYSKVAILAQNFDGYKNLVELISLARTVKDNPSPHIDFDDLRNRKSIFALVTNESELHSSIQNGRAGNAQEILSKFKECLAEEDILIELFYPKSNNQEETKELNLKLIKFCKGNNIRYVVSPAPRYIEKDDEEVFRAILGVRDGKKLYDIELERSFHLPDVDELKGIFDYCLEVFDTEYITSRIGVEIRTDYDKHANEAFFPIFDLPDGQTPDKALTRDTYLALIAKFSKDRKTVKEWGEIYKYEDLDKLKQFALTIEPSNEILGYSEEYWKTKTIKDYVDRIDYELDVIITKGFPAYFLVLADLMDFCQKNDIVTNTRGSGAGCLVGYLNKISILDPLVYDIPFERFLNPLRPSAPDIDGDFADDKRGMVIEYITQKYGATKVCQIITFGAMLPRAGVRDIGRVLGVSYGKCDKLSKIIPRSQNNIQMGSRNLPRTCRSLRKR